MKTPSPRGPQAAPRPSRPSVFIWAAPPALGLTLGVIILLEQLRYQLVCQSAPSTVVIKDVRSLCGTATLAAEKAPSCSAGSQQTQELARERADIRVRDQGSRSTTKRLTEAD